MNNSVQISAYSDDASMSINSALFRNFRQPASATPVSPIHEQKESKNSHTFQKSQPSKSPKLQPRVPHIFTTPSPNEPHSLEQKYLTNTK